MRSFGERHHLVDEMMPIYLRKSVRVGPLLREYAPAMARWMTDPEVSENLGLRNKPSLERTSQWIEKALHDSAMRVFAISVDGQYVGNVVIDQINSYQGTGRLSVYVGESAARGSRAGITGLYLAILQGFKEVGLRKIHLTVHPHNFRAISCYVKLGFIVEGVLREEFLFRGERMAALYMGLLPRDFELVPAVWI